MLAVRKRRSSIRCRESRSPIGCCESLLVGRTKLFLSAKPIGPTRPTKGYCALVVGFMGPLGQIPQATRVLLDRASTTLLLHQWAGLTHPNAVSHRWASVEPSTTGHPKTTKFTPAVGGAHPCMPNRSLRAHRPPPPPGLPHKLLLGTSSRQISNAYLGRILVWRLSYILLLFGGTLGSGHSRLGALPQDSTPTTYYHTRQIRITFIVLVDVSVKS